jgi:hypothetical protein
VSITGTRVKDDSAVSDDSYMSARTRHAVREGDETHGDATAKSYVAGIGASGALLAGAVILFISLVGFASFEVWPGSGGGNASPATVELAPAKPESSDDQPPGLALAAIAPLVGGAPDSDVAPAASAPAGGKGESGGNSPAPKPKPGGIQPGGVDPGDGIANGNPGGNGNGNAGGNGNGGGTGGDGGGTGGDGGRTGEDPGNNGNGNGNGGGNGNGNAGGNGNGGGTGGDGGGTGGDGGRTGEDPGNNGNGNGNGGGNGNAGGKVNGNGSGNGNPNKSAQQSEKATKKSVKAEQKSGGSGSAGNSVITPSAVTEASSACKVKKNGKSDC